MPILVVRPRASWWRLVLPFVLTLSAVPVLAQPVNPSPSAAVPDYKAESERFQARIDATASALCETPSYERVSAEYLQGLVEFITGNMLFVLLHEFGQSSSPIMTSTASISSAPTKSYALWSDQTTRN